MGSDLCVSLQRLPAAPVASVHCEAARPARPTPPPGGQPQTPGLAAPRKQRAAAMPMARPTLVVCAAALAAWAPLGGAVNKARDLSTVSQSGLKLWVTVDSRVDVDGGRVAQWNDISHEENHVKQNSAGARRRLFPSASSRLFSSRGLRSLSLCCSLG